MAKAAKRKERVYVPHARLLAAREQSYASAADAAEAMNIPAPTYAAHENGSRGLGRSAVRYAKFFRVSVDWLLTGRGSMRGNRVTIPVWGRVGAGATVEMDHDAEEIAKGDVITMPGPGEIGALVVQGDSQYPRFRDGEIVLFDPSPVLPQTLIGQYAIVDTHDGRTLIKRLKRGLGDNRWNLESHNAETEENVELIGARRYLGSLAGR